jgi:hypothetical protein
MSVLRKLLGPLLAVVAVAALVGVALPASPASAVPQCRWEIDPQPDCPTMPVVPPPMRPREPAPTMVPQPGGPVAQPGETCRNAESRSTIVIRESGLPEKPVYQLIVNVDFCYRNGAVTRATVTSRTTPPADARLTAISQTSTADSSPLGEGRYLNVQQVFFTGCGDPTNIASCRNYRHTVQVGVTGDGTLSASGALAFFDGSLPPNPI